MKFLCMIFADEKAGAHLTDQDQLDLIDEMMAYDRVLTQGGHLAGGDALLGNEKTMTVAVRNSKVLITDGPFIETKEQFTGTYLFVAKDMTEAVDLASKIPAARYGHIEVRPVRNFLQELAPKSDVPQGTIEIEEPRVIDADPMLFAGLHHRLTVEQMGDIPQIWDRFVPYMGTSPNRNGASDYGLIFGTMDMPGGIDYVPAFQVSGFQGVPEKLMRITVPAQKYLAFPHKHHVSRLSETIGGIFSSWFPRSSYKARSFHSNLPATIEVYSGDFNPATGMGGMEVWVPV